MVRTLVAAALALVLACAHPVDAQEWPARTLTMVVPFPAGGPIDVVARILAPPMGEALGQQIIVENIGGAGGSTGASRVAKAPPDGYQFLIGNSGTHTYSQLLSKKPPYDAVADFTPVAVFVENSKVLVTRNDLAADTLAQFIAYAKANQAKMQYGSAGAGSATHMTCVLLNAAIGIDVTHVPYRGTGPAMQDLMGGRIDYICDVISTALPLIRSRSVKPIALAFPAAQRGAARSRHRRRAGPGGLRCRRLERVLPAPRHARADRAPPRQGGERRARPGVGARAARRPRPQRTAAATPHPRISGQAGRERAGEMGGAGQGERRERGVTIFARRPCGIARLYIGRTLWRPDRRRGHRRPIKRRRAGRGTCRGSSSVL